MTVEFLGVGATTPIPPHALLRATFATRWATFILPGDDAERLRMAYRNLQDGLAATGLGYVASALAVAPDDVAMTVDIRCSSSGSPTAAAAASNLDEAASNFGPDAVKVARLELVPPGEGSEQAADNREQASAAAAAAPGLLEQVKGWIGSASSWVLWVLALLVVLVLLYLFHK